MKRAAELGISLYLNTEQFVAHGKAREQYCRDRNHRVQSNSSTRNTSQPKSITISLHSVPKLSPQGILRTTKSPSSKYAKNTPSELFNVVRPQKPLVARASAPVRFEKHVGFGLNGHVVQTFSTRKGNKLRDWERDDPDSETIEDVVLSGDENTDDIKTTARSSAQSNIVLRDEGGNECRDVEVVGCVEDDRNKQKKMHRISQTNDRVDDFWSKEKSYGCIVGAAGNIAPRGKSWMIVTQRMVDQYSP